MTNLNNYTHDEDCSCTCDCEEYFCEHQCYTECTICGRLNIPVLEFGAADICELCEYKKMQEDARLA